MNLQPCPSSFEGRKALQIEDWSGAQLAESETANLANVMQGHGFPTVNQQSQACKTG